MNARLLILMFAGLLLTACSVQSVADETRRTSDPECEGDPDAPVVRYYVDAKRAVPECVRARLGTTIVFRLTPRTDLKVKTVRIDPNDSLRDSWLQGINHPFDDVIFIRVPGKYDPKEEPEFTDHVYSVVVGEMMIDPRVEVEN